MRIVPVPCLSDNYAYLVICEQTRQAAVVDPSEAKPVLAAAEREGVTLAAIWTTHHHWDHTGGNEELARVVPGIAVVGFKGDERRIPKVTRLVSDGDTVAVGEQVRARVIHNPGHTIGAISYFMPAHQAVFTGDTLFLAGCGRMFEGTPPSFHASLQTLAALPDDARVFCGHEYTAKNLMFAAAVEPGNDDIRARKAEVARAGDAPTVPATVGVERRTNPFLRVGEPSVAAAARDQGAASDDPVEVFRALRAWKDRF